LDRAEYALEDAKNLINRARANLKNYGMAEEASELNDMYYSIGSVLDNISNETKPSSNVEAAPPADTGVVVSRYKPVVTSWPVDSVCPFCKNSTRIFIYDVPRALYWCSNCDKRYDKFGNEVKE
jgi:hypothetical protein